MDLLDVYAVLECLRQLKGELIQTHALTNNRKMLIDEAVDICKKDIAERTKEQK